jgi:ATP:ADP antiporter, AAA family
MAELLSWLKRLVDVRRGEWRALVKAFATLMLLIAAHTALETARDALILTRLPSSALSVVYVAVALCALPVVWLASRATVRFGPQRALGGGLVSAAALLVVLFLVPMTRATAVAVYVTSGMIGAVLVPLYWNVLASIFNVSQARRLLGIVGAAGVLGGALGSTAAATLLIVVHTRVLLLVSAGVLLVTVAALSAIPVAERPPPRPTEVLPSRRDAADLREEPFLRRIALLVVISTAAALFLDYFFKWTVARTVPHDEIARFVARYYAWLNGLSLVAQLFVTGALVRRIGITTTLVVTPMLLMLGGVGALAASGALMAVLAVKALDGTLRNSVHRFTMELVYLPVPAELRARAKPFIDGALARLTQAAAGLLLLGLAGADYASSWLLGGIVVAATLAWLAVAITTRGPYLGLLRHAVMGNVTAPPDLDPIDLESAERLVELLASEDPLVVLGAMNALARRRRERLIPALILLHEDVGVRVSALGIFGSSTREDWIPRARRLLTDPRDSVRTAAARALAIHGRLDAKDLALDADPHLHAYAALQLSLAEAARDPLDDPAIAELLDRPGADGERGRLGLLAVIVDAKRNEKLSHLLAALEARAGMSREWTEGLAMAAASQQATGFIPQLVSRLVLRDTRETLRVSLVSFGRVAMDEVWRTLLDPLTQRRLRVHLPNTLARFGTSAAAELLLRCIETEPDGLVRYKAIRGLGRVIADLRITVDRARVERIAHANLVEHFRLLGLRAALTASPSSGPDEGARATTTQFLLVGLLDDKLRQSLERAFRLLKIAHPRDDIHRVQLAGQSENSRVRANAGEFLNTLLRRHDQGPLRELFLLIVDELSIAERVARGSALLHTKPPSTCEAALALLTDDADTALAALARLHAASVAGKPAQVAIGGRLEGRPSVELSTAGLPVAGVDADGRSPDA